MPKPPKSAAEARALKLAAALRENLKRRKAQERARREPEPSEAPDHSGASAVENPQGSLKAARKRH